MVPQTEGYYQLLKAQILKKDVNVEISLTAISATGHTVAVLTDKRFFVYTTTPEVAFVCGGEFFRQTDFQYDNRNRSLKSQHPTPDKFKVKDFSCVALSDSFLAIGVPGKVMAFYLHGDHAGRWVFCDSMHSKVLVMRLKFSRDGKQLLSLLQYVENNIIGIKAKIYNTEEFPISQFDRRKPAPPTNPSEVTWNCDDTVYMPSAAAFSRDGNMIALCTNCSHAFAQIQLLKKFENGWVNWVTETVRVFPTDDPRDWHGDGLTGISLYFPCE